MKLLALLLVATAGLVCASYWMEEIAHQGRSPYFPDLRYQVFRNVKDYGAVGDGGRRAFHGGITYTVLTERSH